MSKLAVVLFNLGGPDRPEAVKPFLFNLFSDPAIIGLPNPFRWLLAKLISTRRAPVAREIYANIGGKSPLLELTRAQAAALEAALAGDREVKVFVAMRYWHPMSDRTAAEVAAWGPDEVVLLPLYPQFSTTTVESSVKDWRRAATKAGLAAPTRTVCCYPTQSGWIKAQADLLSEALAGFDGGRRPRVLFSAHGLPKKVITGGDPYQWQVEQTSEAVVRALPSTQRDGLDWLVCYQSRVGPLEWIGPSTEDEIVRGGADKVPLIVVPVAFVSEHSETLVELDIEYRELADERGVPEYVRVPAVGIAAPFIAGLAEMVDLALSRADGSLCSQNGSRICPSGFRRCPHNGGAD